MEQKNLILGFDFGEKYSQFCCYDRGTHTAVSIPVKRRRRGGGISDRHCQKTE